MKRLEIPFLDTAGLVTVGELSELLDDLSTTPIDCNPWPVYQTSANAKFIMAHNNASILLKYIIAEKYLIANEVTNGNIHKDSCVELFIAFDENGYYNLEFNCLGFSKIAYGNGRHGRRLLPIDAIKKLSFSSKINSNSSINLKTGFDWEIMLVIPKEVFAKHQIISFQKLRAKGNFYKCGDDLPEPHFLTWNTIEAATPDFHRKDFFGELEFD